MARPKKDKPNRQDGLYEVKVTVGKTFTGKLIRKSFYSAISKADARKQAEQYKVEKEVAKKTNNAFIDGHAPFAAWANEWLRVYKKPDVSENTYRITYESTVNKHLIPYFGDADLKDILPENIKEFYNTKRNMSESMLDKMKLCLNGIFETAIENDKCYKNPAKKITYTSDEEKHEKKVYSDLEIMLVKKFSSSRMPEIHVILETGIRRGELIGLRWGDINTKNQVLSVNRSIADLKGGGLEERPPKWKSYRDIPMSPALCALFDSMDRGKDTDYVFLNDEGNLQSPNSWSQKLARFMKLLHKEYPKVQELTAHELRHTYGTMLRRKGVDIYSIQKIMGHKDIKMTSEIYVHNEIDTLKKEVQKAQS